ncbi:autotransporter outer membrane beta-barrel domain-containing protein [Desulfotalea psychrophila]|uniref:Related to serine protease n=1 Tax=Desulfotalea psychrophila (strain LSv54 / DSM 12343) TaxID=177439 RepID=Q6ARP9_DESPS|nr:autotransporter outer membrane beta-barrel domain-containing protein [Desulfotalea psychrophila]CAG34976.1 related to serine protease [Desulfotalea psychrophila LSv54]
MRKTKLYLALASLMLATPAHSYETITVGNFEAQLLAPGESAYAIGAQTSEGAYTEVGDRRIITGTEAWTEGHRDAISRSLQALEQSFAMGSPKRKMQIAFALKKGKEANLGDSLGTLIYDQYLTKIISTGELLLRDNSPTDKILGSVDDTINIYTSTPLHYGPDAPGHDQYDFQSTVTHEILHAMGIMNGNDTDGSYPNGITRWDSLLEDGKGGHPTPENSPSMTTTGKLGTVFWTGAAAKATYGGPVPIQTFADGYKEGSSLGHPGPAGELMTYQSDYLEFPRAPNKLLLDMFRDMGWKINEAYYNSFGPTYYSNNSRISNTNNFETSHSYTYGMYVNGNYNLIEQSGNLKTTKEYSNTLHIYGDKNIIRVSGKQSAEANYSHALYAFGRYNQIFIEREGALAARGDGSVGILLFGADNTIFHSGTIKARDGATAIRIDNPFAHQAQGGHVLNASLHIQTGSEIVGNIINSASGMADMTFGSNYASDGISSSPDPDFNFSYNDEIRGNWHHTITAGKLNLGASAIIEGNMVNYGTLAGNGTIIGDVDSAGIIAPGNSIGKLTINGNLSQTSSSDLQIEFGDGGYDQLVVSGTAHLDGALSLIPIGYLAPGTHQFINAGALAGNFATVNNFSSSILQTSAASLNPSNFTLTRRSYASVSESQQQSLASAFDRARPTASGDMADTLNLMDLMDLTDIRQAADDFSPYFYNSVTTAILENIRTRSTFLQNKIRGDEADRQSPLWFSGYGGTTQYDKTITSNDFKTKYAGFMLGFDRQFASGFQLGAAGAFTDFSLKEKATTSKARGSVYDGYLYGSWSPQANDAFYLQSTLGIGLTDSKTNRNIPFLDRTATSDHDAIHYSAFLGGGYKQQIGNWSLEPRAGFEYINLDEDGCTEYGAGAASLAVNSKDSDALVSSLGVEISHTFDLNNGLLVPSFRADWFHNFSAEGEDTIATLQSGETFSVDGRTASENALELALGLRVLVSDKLHAYLEYQYTFADHQNGAHLLSTGLSYYF